MWKHELRWSFEPTRRRLEGALSEGALTGFAATDARGVCAYATYAVEAGHGMVGAFFAADRARGRGLEARLVSRILNHLLTRDLRAIDCQTLFSSDRGLTEPFIEHGFESAARLYMTLDRHAFASARKAFASTRPSRPVKRMDVASVARLVFDAHQETRAKDASSSFDTPESCRRILEQVMLEDVCGPFDAACSRLIEAGGQAVAACVLTWPLAETAHISEVATAPSQRRRGLARQCVLESLSNAFDDKGAQTVTLSVTASNLGARRLYESLGFETRIHYESHVRRGRPS